MVLGGCERTEAEYKNLLGAAGFWMTDVIPTRSPLSLIKAVPAYAASQVVRDDRRKKRGATPSLSCADGNQGVAAGLLGLSRPALNKHLRRQA
jgi:hypothetical protein